MLPHLFAILGFAAMCGLWVLVQRRAGAPPGGCGACTCGGGQGKCEREREGAQDGY